MYPGCTIQDFCCAVNATGTQKGCADIAGLKTPKCLIQIMGAVWNSGIKMAQIPRSPNDLNEDDHNGFAQGSTAGEVHDDIFRHVSP